MVEHVFSVHVALGSVPVPRKTEKDLAEGIWMNRRREELDTVVSIRIYCNLEVASRRKGD